MRDMAGPEKMPWVRMAYTLVAPADISLETEERANENMLSYNTQCTSCCRRSLVYTSADQQGFFPLHAFSLWIESQTEFSFWFHSIHHKGVRWDPTKTLKEFEDHKKKRKIIV